MPSALRRPRIRTANYWPGFVDALSTLLLVITFLLMIYASAQFFLNQAITGRDEALERLQSQVGELSDLLALERRENTDLRLNMSQLSQELQASLTAREDLREQMRAANLRAEDAARQAKETGSQLENAFKTIMADKASIEVQVREIAKLNNDLDALRALKAELEKEVTELAGQARLAKEQATRTEEDLASAQAALVLKSDELAKAQSTLSEKDLMLLRERELSESARAQVALLNRQMAALREQLTQLNAALEASEKISSEQKAQIANLGQRLNAALATKVQELSRYRSEFFGRLREILGERRDVRIVGDRFVFQSEVLFASGSADLGEEGKKQIAQLADALKEIAAQIPPDIDWILQVDGHTDRIPINTPRYPSNWDLSVARAVAVVQFLIAQGIPSEHLAAAGFGEFRPLDPGNDEIALRRNRRIEFKLTNR